MLCTMSLSVGLLASCGNPPIIQPFDTGGILEDYRRNLLDSVRSGRRFVEKTIREYEANAVLFDRLHSPEDAQSARKQAEELRRELPKYDQLERELLEKQPGGYTAPPPRRKGMKQKD